MRTVSQERAAGVLALLAAVVSVSLAAVMITDAVRTQSARQPDKTRVADLRAQVQQSAADAPTLQAEYERQRDVSLQRNSAYRIRAWLLLASGAVLLGAVKWLTNLRRARP